MSSLPKTDEDAATALAALATEIAHHSALYHTNDAPEISDADYDALVRRNSAIEAAFPHLIRTDSPSRLVGAAPAGHLAQVAHARPMMSLDNAFSVEEVEEFFAPVRRLPTLADAKTVDPGPDPHHARLSCLLRHERGRRWP